MEIDEILSNITRKITLKESPQTELGICPSCNGSGWIFYEDERGYTMQKECSCGALAKQRMESKIRFANLPETFRTYRLKEFSLSYYSAAGREILRKSCKTIKAWLDNYETMKAEGQGLYLFSGTKGSGKTMMAACIANELMIEKKEQVKFATSMQIINEIKATWNNGSTEFNSESQLLASLVTTPVLIIDDFGTEKARDWVSEVFYSIINGRYVDRKVTIFTSNMSLDNLEYDGRITNRIIERAYQVPFPEESVREAIARKKTEELINLLK